MIEKVTTDTAPAALGHYEQGIVANGFVFTAMQLPIDPKNPDSPVADIKTQTKQVIENVLAIVEAAGGSKETLVQMRLYLSDINDWEAANEVYVEVMGDAKPARSVVAISGLHKGYGIAIEGVAAV